MSSSSSSSSSSCKHCALPPCVSYEGVPFCLLHYQAYSTHGKDDSMKAIVTNADVAARQFPEVQKVLKEVMTDVLLRMHDYQRKEQNTLSEDPLAILSLHAPSTTATSSSMMDVSVPSHARQSKRATATISEQMPNSKKHKKENLWNASGSGKKEEHDDDDGHDQITSSMTGEENNDDYLHSVGPPCSKCSSTKTLVKFDSSNISMTGTRSEVWGNKDNEGGHTKSSVVCQSCGHEVIRIE